MQQVSYRGRTLDRKKAVYSAVKSDWKDFDGVAVTEEGQAFPELIEKYRLLCQKEANTELNHCVATLLPKTSSSIGVKQEDLHHLEKESNLYVLILGSDCPFELHHDKDANLKLVIPKGSLLILGQDTLKVCKIAFPLRVHSDPSLMNKARLVLMFRSVKAK